MPFPATGRKSPDACSSRARAAARPDCTMRSSWWNSSSPTPIDDGPTTHAPRARAAGASDEEAFDPDQPMDDGNPLGEPESAISWRVDVGPWLERRRAALEAHRSQTTDVGMMLSMPPEMFAAFFGHEHYIEPGRPPGMVDGWPFGD